MRKVLLPLLVLAMASVAAAGAPELTVKAGNGQACVTESASYSIQLTNTGPASDRYELNVDGPWKDSATFSSSTVRVDEGATDTLFLWIQVPESADRSEHGFTVSARSSNTGRTASDGGTVEVLSCRSVSIEPEDASQTVCRGNDAVYSFEVENDGQVEETYHLTADFGTLSEESVTLAPGEEETVTLTASSMEAAERSIQVRAESDASYAADTTTVDFVSEECRGVEVAIAPEESTICRSDSFLLTASTTNTGEITDDYVLAIGEETYNLTLDAGETETVEREFAGTDIEGNVQVSVQSRSHPDVRTSAVSDITVNACHDMSLTPTSVPPETANRTLMELALVNNGTQENTYHMQIDGPDWMDVRPLNATMEPGEESTVYVYMAPDFFGDGFFTATLVGEGEGIRKTVDMNVTAVNGTVTVDFQETRTPTGFIPTSTSGIVPLIITALILLFGGYWFFRNGEAPMMSATQTRDYHKSADDFLAQNANTVVKAVREDDLSDEFLKVLLEEEKQDKNRQRVLNQIRRELGDL